MTTITTEIRGTLTVVDSDCPGSVEPTVSRGEFEGRFRIIQMVIDSRGSANNHREFKDMQVLG